MGHTTEEEENNDEEGEVGLVAAQLLGLLPETYAEACVTAVAKQAKRVAERAEKKLKAEQETP